MVLDIDFSTAQERSRKNDVRRNVVLMWHKCVSEVLTIFIQYLLSNSTKRRNRSLRRRRSTFGRVTRGLSERKFMRYFRISRYTFRKLLNLVRPALTKNAEMARRSSGGVIMPDVRLAATLRILAGGSYIDCAMLFNIEDSTLSRIFRETVHVLNKELVLKTRYRDDTELRRLSYEFAKSRASPLCGCVGALDGIVVAIHRPHLKDCNNPNSYWNRKGFFGIPVQAVCDARGRFLFVSSKCAGSTHDSSAFEITSLGRFLSSGCLKEGFWIAADEAYPCSDVLLTPWPSSTLNEEKDAFNFHLSSLRIHIEQAFGMLVNRWGILWRPLRCRLKNASKIFICCAKLHNFSVDNNEGLLYLSIKSRKRQREKVKKWWTEMNSAYREFCRQGKRRDLEMSAKRMELTDLLAKRGICRPHCSRRKAAQRS